MGENMILDELTPQQIEMLRAISHIVKSKKLKIFTISELAMYFPYLKYMTLYIRITRLKQKGVIENVAKGVYTLTAKGQEAIYELENLYRQKQNNSLRGYNVSDTNCKA